MGYVTTRKSMVLCGFAAIKAAESSGAADDTVDFGGMSRNVSRLFTLTLEFIAGMAGLKGLSPALKHGRRLCYGWSRRFRWNYCCSMCFWFVIMSVALRRC